MAHSIVTTVRETTEWFSKGQRAAKLILAMVLSIDLLLGMIHIVVMVGWDAPDIWRIDMDGSYGEAFQYAKYVWVLLLLVVYARRERNWPILAWVPLIAYFVVDDAVLVHERAGLWFSSQSWAFELGPISAQNVGELAISAAIGAVLFVVLVVGYVRADARTRWIFRVMVALLVVLLVFAVVVDAVHGLVTEYRFLDRSLGFFEDLGEMLALTLLVAFCFRINVSGGFPGFPRETLQPAATRREQRGRRGSDENPVVALSSSDRRLSGKTDRGDGQEG